MARPNEGRTFEVTVRFTADEMEKVRAIKRAYGLKSNGRAVAMAVHSSDGLIESLKFFREHCRPKNIATAPETEFVK